ncbi:MAG: FAD-dependent oxidoreductase [Spirochaetia bacterium]|nr:FAD-dependent oxidoreductase [Spirochaetia bacterium]
MKRVLIIGGSDVGITAGLRICELDSEADVSVLSGNTYPNFSICGIPFFLGGEIADYQDLAHRTADEIRASGLKLYLGAEVRTIDPKARKVVFIDSEGEKTSLGYDKLVIGTGGKSALPNIPGLDLPGVFTLRWINEARRIDRFIKETAPREAVIVGGGYIGLEMTEALIRRGIKVKLLEFLDQILPTVDKEFAEIVRTGLENRGAEIFTRNKVERISEKADGLEVLTGNGKAFAAEMILVATGAVPESSLGQSIGVEIGVKGTLKVNRKMETNIEDVYAGGDCVESLHAITKQPVYIALGTTAHKHGRIIGENICGLESKYPGTLGTQSLKLFDMVIARTGLNDREAAEAGFEPYTHSFETWDHKQYYPPAHKLNIRFTADKNTQRLLGCQIIGPLQAEVSKRIDIIAVALQQGLGVSEFVMLDLSYTPPLSSPWDPVQMAAAAWLNVNSGKS